MNEAQKIQTHHLERDAYLYIRQSSIRQVLENQESAKRQYALRSRATALGWPDDRIIVIDSDQGESGASAAGRTGFQRLVTEVGMGHAGIVMGLEVSRLARNSADWHRLLEICALTETLILDEDGVYDPRSFNDRLLLGLKGTMSEAELHVLKARLRGGILNKVRRGEYRCLLPTGFVYDEQGEVVMDPDSQVRETIAYFFQTFSRVGSAHQTVKAFRKEGVLFPSLLRRQGNTQIIFRPLTTSTAMRILYNPRYAGAYAYGRRRYRNTANGKKSHQKRDPSEWLACFPDSHPGYITWDQYQENLRQLKSNGRGYEEARKSPPREGSALLQGRAICGRCGSYLRSRYASRRGKTESWYICDRAKISGAEPYCQWISGGDVDQTIGARIAETMTSAAIDGALEIRREVEARYQEADQLRCRAIERAQTEADLAQRRFMMTDPSHRLVADTLEADWNEKLRALAKAREEREQYLQEKRVTIPEAVRERLIAMTSDFKKLWSNPATPNRERKRMLAYLIEDVTLVKLPKERVIQMHIRFKGGKVETLRTPNPKLSGGDKVRTSAKVVALVDQLLENHIYDEIAEILNERGFQPGGSARPGGEDARFTSKRVAYLVHRYGLKSRYDRLRERGLLTKGEMTARLGIHEHTLIRWADYGIVTRHFYNARWCLYEDPGPNPPIKHTSRWDRLIDRAAKVGEKARDSQTANLEPKEL